MKSQAVLGAFHMESQELKRQKAHQHLSNVVLSLVRQKHYLAALRANLRPLRYCPCNHSAKTYRHRVLPAHCHLSPSTNHLAPFYHGLTVEPIQCHCYD